VPEAGQFKDVESYWATLLHEAVHSTGHESRLDRDLDTSNKTSYAFEELIAEMGSAFLCAQMGIERGDLTANHASYIAGWKQVLTADPKAFMRAAKLARQASDYVLDYSGASEYTSEDEEAA
jgi:antirestriction protein ArdC